MLYSHSSSKRIFERQPVEANALLSLGTQLQPRGEADRADHRAATRGSQCSTRTQPYAFVGEANWRTVPGLDRSVPYRSSTQ